jgi:hypothetical protein
MLPLRLRLWFPLGKPELEAELEAPAEPVAELDDEDEDSMNLICLLSHATWPGRTVLPATPLLYMAGSPEDTGYFVVL